VLEIKQRDGGAKKAEGNKVGEPEPKPKPKPKPEPKPEPKPKPKPKPTQCSVSDLTVSCDHKRTAGASGVLQVVGTGKAGGFSASTESPSDHQGGVADGGVSYTVTQGGIDKITVLLAGGEQCAGPHATALTDSGSPPSTEGWVDGKEHTFEVRWAGDEPLWQSNEPQKFVAMGRRCDGTHVERHIEMYQPTQVALKVSATGIGKRMKESEWADVASSARRFAQPIIVDGPELKDARGELGLQWGWREVPGDWRVQWCIQGSGTVNVGLELGSVTINVLAIAGTMFAIPPNITSFLTEYSIRLDLVIGGSLDVSLGLGEISVVRYTDGSFGAGIGAAFGAGIEISVGLALRIGSEWIQSCTVEVGGKGGADLNGAVTVNDRGLFATCEGKLKPVTAYVRIVKKGFFSNSTVEGSTELFTCGESVGFSDHPLATW
jgi:hypothetical protein